MNTNSTQLRGSGWSRLLAAAGLSLCAVSAAFAQTPAPTEKPEDVVKLETFNVTGSFLPVSAAVTASPVVTIQSSDIGQSGATDPMRLLRQLTPYFSGSGNIGTESNNGEAGESYVALRNLTTLVLINGQRITSSPFSNSSSQGSLVDLNTIPVAMIDHIDILKDGASTIYGSDAIGGVVNVILKKDYNGFEVGGRLGSTDHGDYKTRDMYLIGGAAGNGFSLTLGAEHFENTSLLTTARSIATLSGADINALGLNVTSAVFSGSYPGRVNSDILAGSTLIAIGAPGFNAAITSPGVKSSPNDTSLTGGLTGVAALNYLLAHGVYLVAANTPAGQAVGGSATALNTTLFDNPLISSTKRNQFIANADKELFGKNLEVFGDFMFAQTINSGSGLAPTPISGVGPSGGNSLFIPANNPYNVFNVDFPGPLSARSRTIEIGKRSSVNETNTWRFVGGFKGAISDNYSWEVTYAYSRASLLQRILGGVNGANLNAAMIPLLNGSGGYVYNAAGKPLSTLTDANGNNLPVYNFFALPGFNDPATIAALETTLFESGDSSLRNIRGVLNGKPFELPAGDLTFALGIEARTEEITASVDALFANGLAIGYNPANPFSGGSRSTKGYFLEVGVPLASPKQAIPGLYTVDLNLADREEQLSPGGNANTPKFGVRWLPIDDQFVIRATYSKGFIAPYITNLFGPTAGNSPTLSLPEGNGQAGSGGSLGTNTTIQINSNQLSNPNLPPSDSKSYTAGFVYSPKAVKGLSFTADYYHITQDKVGGFDYTAIAADLNAKGSGSIYAGGFTFADGSHLTSVAPNQVTSTNFGTINVQQNPLGDQETSGLDLAIDYKFKTGSLGSFDVGASANILFDYRARTSPIAPYYQYARTYTDLSNSAGFANGLLPSYIIKPYLNHTYGPVSTSLYFTYIPTVTTNGGVGNAPGQNPDTINGQPYKIPSYFSMDLGISYTLPNFGQNWLRNATLTVGMNNVFNKAPPYVPVDGNPPGENNTVESTYDIIGRFAFVELKKAF